jgi:hypothetical protein
MLSHRQAALDFWQVQRAAAFGGLCLELNLNWKEQDGRTGGLEHCLWDHEDGTLFLSFPCKNTQLDLGINTIGTKQMPLLRSLNAGPRAQRIRAFVARGTRRDRPTWNRPAIELSFSHSSRRVPKWRPRCETKAMSA